MTFNAVLDVKLTKEMEHDDQNEERSEVTQWTSICPFLDVRALANLVEVDHIGLPRGHR